MTKSGMLLLTVGVALAAASFGCDSKTKEPATTTIAPAQDGTTGVVSGSGDAPAPTGKTGEYIVPGEAAKKFDKDNPPKAEDFKNGPPPGLKYQKNH